MLFLAPFDAALKFARLFSVRVVFFRDNLLGKAFVH